MKVTVNPSNIVGKVKPMHCVNNGPTKGELGNFESFKALEIPYVRNHDASFYSGYGGEHTVDVHAIFPDFNADANDESSYDFTLTDEYTLSICEANSNVFYRLGTKIEHWNKKYGTIKPPDFNKWAVICEHIIRHYNEGWANGYKLGITYWEIWNEADGVEDNGKPNWSGTDQEYYELYVISATHLKKCFPYIKIGGPALSWAGKTDWINDFLTTLTANGKRVPLDFFSWHEYCFNPVHFDEHTYYLRKTLDDFGYADTELHVNEYNYLIPAGLKASIPGIIGIRGASFVASVMAHCQKLPMDMLMYYDCRPGTVFNGVFDFYYKEPLKSYYALKAFSAVYKLHNEIETLTDSTDLYAVASTNENNLSAMVVYYPFDENCITVEKVEIDFANGFNGNVAAFLTDKDNTETQFDLTFVNGKCTIELKPNSILLLKK